MLRAGVPLDLGLQGLVGTQSQTIDKVAREMGDRLAAGATLVDVVEEQSAFPESLKAVLIAGIRCDRPEEALQDLIEVSLLMGHLRAALMRSMIYPTFLVAATILVATVGLFFLRPALIEMSHEFGWALPGIIQFWLAVSTVELLIVAGFVVCGIVIGLWRLGWGKSVLVSLGNLLGWSRVQRDLTVARVSHLLAILTKYHVPLPEALSLAAAGSDSVQWKKQIETLRQFIERGEVLSQSTVGTHGFPAFLSWLIEVGVKEGSLPETLRQAAIFYQQRGIRRAEFLQQVIPALSIIFIGGGITLMYGLAVFESIIQLWTTMAKPII